MSDEPCPRCGENPIEVRTFGSADPTYVPACTCYPKPPRCLACKAPLDGDRCGTVSCWAYDIIQPDPIIDPLWSDQ